MAQSINLQIIPNGVLPKVYASQFDVGREVQFNLFDGASAYTPPAGTAIRFEGRKSDGNGFSYACTNVGNVVTVELTDQMTVFAEEIPCEIRMALNGDDIGTLNVILCVEKSPIDAGVPISDTEIPAIIDLARQEQYTAEAWAKGTRNGVPVTPGDPTYNNNSEYWAEQSQAATQGALKYKGSCLFANIPTTGLNQGDMWNIEDDFTTDNRFQEGSGIPVKAGSNIAWNSNSKWDVLAMQKIYSLSDLIDTVISSPADGEVLTYDNVAGKWKNKSKPAYSVSDLSDVTILSIADGQILQWDNVAGKWVNANISVTSIDADDVVYNNTASGLTATDAQAALDEIVGNVNTVQSNIDDVVDMIAPVESGATASQPYDIGDQFIFGGQLVKATSVIALGQAITVGSGGNCVPSDTLIKQIGNKFIYYSTAYTTTDTYGSMLKDLANKALAAMGTFTVAKAWVYLGPARSFVGDLTASAFTCYRTQATAGGGGYIRNFIGSINFSSNAVTILQSTVSTTFAQVDITSTNFTAAANAGVIIAEKIF